MKQNIYSLTVGDSQNPENFINLTSQGKNSVCFSVNSNGRTSDFVITSKDDLARIAEFLQKQCDTLESVKANSPSYTATGVGLCVLDQSGRVLDTFFGQSGKGIDGYVPAWDYDLCHQLFPHPNAVYVFFDLFDGSISRSFLINVLQTCMASQAGFEETGNPAPCWKMVLQDVADKFGCDIAMISRVTKNIRIITQDKIEKPKTN